MTARQKVTNFGASQSLRSIRERIRNGLQLFLGKRSDTMRALLPSLSQMADAAATPGASPFQAWLQDRLRGVRSQENWLDDLPLYVAAPFCEALGVSSLHEPKVKVARFIASDWAAAADAGFRIASAGEEFLRTFLGSLNDAQSSTRGFWGPRDTYGYAYGLLQKTVDDPAYAKLRDAVRHDRTRDRRARRTSGRPQDPHGSHRGPGLRRACPHNPSAFQTNGRRRRGRAIRVMDHRILVTSGEVHRLISELKDAITAPEVEKLLGVPRLHLKALVAGGHLSALADMGFETHPVCRIRAADPAGVASEGN